MEQDVRVSREDVRAWSKRYSLDAALSELDDQEKAKILHGMSEDEHLLGSLADVVLSLLEMEEELPPNLLPKHKERLERVVRFFVYKAQWKAN